METVETHAGLILLDAKPLGTNLHGFEDNLLHVDLPASEGTVLEGTAFVLHGIVGGNTDKGVRS